MSEIINLASYNSNVIIIVPATNCDNQMSDFIASVKVNSWFFFCIITV